MDSPPARPEYHLKLLGAFGLTAGDEVVQLPAQAQRIVAFLALHGGRATRAYVAGSLMPHVTDRRAMASMRSVLWRIRQRADDLVIADMYTVGLGAHVTIDVEDLADLTTRLMNQDAILDHPAFADLTRELLPGWYDEWVIAQRELLRQRSLHALEVAAERAADHGDYLVAIELALAAIRLDPLREAARRCLVTVYICEGNYAEAVAEYRRYRSLLRSELGIHPSPRFDAVIGGVTLRSRLGDGDRSRCE